MSENEVKKCPKCNGEMEKGRSLIATHAHFWEVLFSKKGDWYGDKIIPLYCKKCGYIELIQRNVNKLTGQFSLSLFGVWD